VKFETRRYFLLPFIPGPKIVVEKRTLFVHRWFRKPKEIPLGSLTVDPRYGGFSIRGAINRLTGCGNLQFTGSAVGSSGYVLHNIKNFKGILVATSSLQSAENILAERGLKGFQNSSDISSKLKISKKTHRTDFGTYPDENAKFEDTKVETPVGTFICHHDGTFSNLKENLMWIQAPWGMEWNGKKFKGESLKVSWDDATKLFGFGGTLPKTAALTKENIEQYGHKKYKRGSCVVTFSGYSDWRLPTAKEVLSLNFWDGKSIVDSEFGYSYSFG